MSEGGGCLACDDSLAKAEILEMEGWAVAWRMDRQSHHAHIAALRAENARLREYVRNAGDTFAGLTGEHGVAGLTYFREKKVWLGRMLDEASRALKEAEA